MLSTLLLCLEQRHGGDPFSRLLAYAFPQGEFKAIWSVHCMRSHGMMTLWLPYGRQSLSANSSSQNEICSQFDHCSATFCSLLQPHQRDVTQLLAAAVQACHDDVHPSPLCTKCSFLNKLGFL